MPNGKSRPPRRIEKRSRHAPVTQGGRSRPERGSGKPVARAEATPAPAPETGRRGFRAAVRALWESRFPGKEFREPEPLAGLAYEDELSLKQEALKAFWKEWRLPDKPNRILPSPEPRHYRSTSKRKPEKAGSGFRLAWRPDRGGKSGDLSGGSLLEPPEHAALFAAIESILQRPPYRKLAGVVHYVVVRGRAPHVQVILNLSRSDADILRKAKLLAEHLRAPLESDAADSARATPTAPPAPAPEGFWVLVNPKKSDFYLELGPATGQLRIKCLYGSRYVPLKFADRKYHWHPLSFSQVNPASIPDLIESSMAWLKPGPGERVLDLYCGYGLFGLQALARGAEVWGADAAETSVEGARLGVRPDERGRGRFRTQLVDAKSLKSLPPPDEKKPEKVILDPPRGGTAPGVIPLLSRRAPAKVVHWVCDLEVLPREIESWRKQGYMLAKAVPVDMFAGTDNLEMMLAFIPDQYGILGRARAPGNGARRS